MDRGYVLLDDLFCYHSVVDFIDGDEYRVSKVIVAHSSWTKMHVLYWCHTNISRECVIYSKNDVIHRVDAPALVYTNYGTHTDVSSITSRYVWGIEGDVINPSGGPSIIYDYGALEWSRSPSDVDIGTSMDLGSTVVRINSFEFGMDDENQCVFRLESNGDVYWADDKIHQIIFNYDGSIFISDNVSSEKPTDIGSDYFLWRDDNFRVHRDYGPALIYSNGRLEWWIHGQEITGYVNAWMDENDICYPFTEEEQALYRITFHD